MIENRELDSLAYLQRVTRREKRAERRRTGVVVGLTVTLVVVLAGGVTKAVVGRVTAPGATPAGTPAPSGSAGAAAAAAAASASAAAAKVSCDAVLTDRTTGAKVHVGPGTDLPAVRTVKYATVPPSSGRHYALPAYPSRAFYTAADRPALETLVHNLEHGYTVVWYTAATTTAEREELKRLAAVLRGDPRTAGKFIVSAWDDRRGAFPAGRTIAMVHWGAKNGFRRFCNGVSAPVITSFVAAYPYADSPEPNAA